jgi:hypothetical protein
MPAPVTTTAGQYHHRAGRIRFAGRWFDVQLPSATTGQGETSMIIEMRTYTLKPGTVPEYYRIYEAEGMAVQREILGNLIAYMHTEFGPLNQIVHMWGYEDLADRTKRRAVLGQNPTWQACVAKMQSLILTQENKILLGAPFSPLK